MGWANYDYAGQDPTNNYDLAGASEFNRADSAGGEIPGDNDVGIGLADPANSPHAVYETIENPGMSWEEWSKRLWGRGVNGALSRMGRSASELRELGLTVNRAARLRNFYLHAYLNGKGGGAAVARFQLMVSIIRTLKGG